MIYQFLPKDINTSIYDYIEVLEVLSENNILCNCYKGSEFDESGNLSKRGELVAHRAVFNMNESEILDLHLGEKECIQGMPPRMEWLEVTIRAYAAYYKIPILESDTKSELIQKINESL